MISTQSYPIARNSHPIPRLIAAVPLACFSGALLTDIAYVRTENIMWVDFSAWLLAAGMAGGVLAAVAGLVAWLIQRRHGAPNTVWPVALGSVLVLVVGFFDNLVHSRDAWTSVMPSGLALSAFTVLLMLATARLAAGASRRSNPAAPYAGVSR